MNILIFAGCNDKKLTSKIKPLLESELVNTIYLVRECKMEFSHSKLIQYPALKLIRKFMPFRELNRLFTGIYLLVTKKIDLIIGIHFLMHGVYTYILGNIFRKKYIHVLIEGPEIYKRAWYFKWMLKGASKIAVRGGRSMNHLIGLGVNKETMFNPPNEFYMPTEINLKALEDKKYDVLFIGNYVDVKNLPLWIEVMSELKKTKNDIKGVMIGDGPLFDDMNNLLIEKGLDKNIDVLGRQNDVNKYINDSKVLLMTSKSEGLPMVVVESMALGVPVVVPNVGDINDLVENNVDGYVIDSREPKDYATSILKIINDSKRYNSFSSKSLQAIKNMSKSTDAKSIVKLWNKVLEEI